MAAKRNSLVVQVLRSPTGLISAVTATGLVILAVVAPFVWGAQAGHIDVPRLLEGSSSDHPLGTDNLGRDLLARILVATRLSLILAVSAVAVGALVGVPWGAIPTVLGRRGGRLVAVTIEFSLAFPGILLVMFLGVVLGVGAQAAVLAIGLASAPTFARLTQTLAASVSSSDYVDAARVLGVSRWRLMTRHVLPNIAEPIILNVTLAIGFALLAMSGLSFIGLGVQPPDYDWGRLLNDALERIYITPEAALGPAVAIVIAGLAFNGLGEALAAAAGKRTHVRIDKQAPEPGLQAHEDAAPDDSPAGDVLVVKDLVVRFPSDGGTITPVRGISFTVRAGEILGIVGESASGKSLTALSIAQLVPHPGHVSASRLEVCGQDIRLLSTKARKRLLGTSLAMVFQDPTTSLNPALRIGTQLSEVAEIHGGVDRRQSRKRAVERLRHVRISSPERRLRQYPHELSGGMRQRASIGMGLMVEPQMIIADEPTSALDVTVQQQVLRLLQEIRDTSGASGIFISHDIAVVAELCDRVLVMYAGRVVEELDAATLRTGPAHPYTRALLASIPDMTTDRSHALTTIPGLPPDASSVPEGCPFAPRCSFATDRCQQRPVLTPVDAEVGHTVACWHPQPADAGLAEPARVRQS